ncbi:MAG: HRDC domain-containing protein, partial [Streptosporangiaceae bacterium]
STTGGGPGRAGGGRGGRRARSGDPGPERGDGTRLDEAARQLFDGLRQWRLETAREQSVPAYVVFSDATLEIIAERAPRSREQLAAVPGVGAVKLDRYGTAVLALCAGPGAGESGEPG